MYAVKEVSPLLSQYGLRVDRQAGDIAMLFIFLLPSLPAAHQTLSCPVEEEESILFWLSLCELTCASNFFWGHGGVIWDPSS